MTCQQPTLTGVVLHLARDNYGEDISMFVSFLW